MRVGDMIRAKSANGAASFETRKIPGWEGTVPCFGARLVCGLLLTLATELVAQAEPPKRVLMLHSFAPEFGDLCARDTRARLSRQLPGRLELYESWLVSARFTDDREDAASASYLSTLLAERSLDLVITLGAPAAKFLQQFHQSLFSSIPELLTDGTLAGVTGNSVIERQSGLPPGSTVLVRELTAWERYRWQIIFIAAVLVLEAASIVTLLHDRRRRRRAELDAHQRMAELAELNRRSTVGELSASIAHELTQPLSAISHNAEAAALILRAQSPDLSELRDIVAGITRDQRCATEVIKRLRNLLGKTPSETQEIDLSEVVREVFEFLSATAAARHITLSTSLATQALHVSGDRIKLQQVILNLVINGIDAIGGSEYGERKIVGRTGLVDDASAEVAIEDSGPGIQPGKEEQIFEPFFTTKAGRMGMGLSIARTIVESHRGRIWAENRRGGGAMFRFSVPLATRELHCMPAKTAVVRKSQHGESQYRSSP